MSNIKDFFYYNRKTIGIVVVIVLLFISTLFLNKPTQIIEKTPTVKNILVDIKGEVKNPGVYKVKEESRIIDVIELSGGLLEKSDISSINLSEKVIDEMLIYIPKKEEVIETVNAEEEKNNKVSNEVNFGKISINTSTLNQLMNIKGIGKVKAQSIIDYRTKNGRFKKIEDLMKVKGIGKVTFDKIKDFIKL